MSERKPERHDVVTGRGVISAWSHTARPDVTPIVLFLRDAGCGPNAWPSLDADLTIYGEPWVVDLPGSGGAELDDDAPAAVAEALDELIQARFSRRDVVVLAAPLAAEATLRLRSPSVRRLVLVEPAAPAELFEDCPPTDIVLRGGGGDTMLSRVPRVRLHLTAAGADPLGEGLRVLSDVLLEACRRASALTPYDAKLLDEPLLEATPLDQGAVVVWGKTGEVFAEALRARHPQCEIVQAEGRCSGSTPCDVLVLTAPPPGDTLEQLAGGLRPGGILVARWAAAQDLDEDLRTRLGALHLEVSPPIDAAGTGVFRARRLGGTPAASRPLHLLFVSFAPLLMDIRTRLPVQQLCADPELVVSYTRTPFDLPPLDRDQPKVLVMQRPAATEADAWRPFMARAIAAGWVVVMEFDDHPLLIAVVLGNEPPPNAMARLGYVHAVQTSTPVLHDAFRPYNPELAIFDNAVFELMPFPAEPRPQRIVYGGVLRGTFAVEVAKALAPALERFPDAHVDVLGDRQVFDAMPTTRKAYLPYTSYEAYLKTLSKAAISLSPLEAAPMRDTKSDAKFLDASRAGVLTIASPTVYDRIIRHGENGWLAEELHDWAPLLERALADPDEQRQVARRAWEEVRDTRMFAHQLRRRTAWYYDLWNRREALNEAVMARLPGLRESVKERTGQVSTTTTPAKPRPQQTPPAQNMTAQSGAEAPALVRKSLTGPPYREFVRDLVAAKKARSYMEVGVHNGSTLTLVEANAIGVDPAFVFDRNPVGGKRMLSLFQMTSDEFFRDHDPRRIFGAPVDVAFLDGMHLFEYLLRDFINTERVCDPTGTILLDDCLPVNIEMTERRRDAAARKDRALAQWWTGDVWKVVSILREYRPDLRITPVDVVPTGSIVVSNLDPASTRLSDAYFEIIDKYAGIDFDLASYERYWATNKPQSAKDLLDDLRFSLHVRP